MKLSQSHELNASFACINCGETLDGAIGVDNEARPKPGDFTLCIYCGHLMAFADGAGLRELTGAEMHEIAGDKRVLQIQRARGRAGLAKRKEQR